MWKLPECIWLCLNTVYEFKVTAIICVPFSTMKLWCILWVWRNAGIFEERVTLIFSRKCLFMVLNVIEGLLVLNSIKRIHSLAAIAVHLLKNFLPPYCTWKLILFFLKKLSLDPTVKHKNLPYILNPLHLKFILVMCTIYD